MVPVRVSAIHQTKHACSMTRDFSTTVCFASGFGMTPRVAFLSPDPFCFTSGSSSCICFTSRSSSPCNLLPSLLCSHFPLRWAFLVPMPCCSDSDEHSALWPDVFFCSFWAIQWLGICCRSVRSRPCFVVHDWKHVFRETSKLQDGDSTTNDRCD